MLLFPKSQCKTKNKYTCNLHINSSNWIASSVYKEVSNSSRCLLQINPHTQPTNYRKFTEKIEKIDDLNWGTGLNCTHNSKKKPQKERNNCTHNSNNCQKKIVQKFSAKKMGNWAWRFGETLGRKRKRNEKIYLLLQRIAAKNFPFSNRRGKVSGKDRESKRTEPHCFGFLLLSFWTKFFG